MPRFYFSTIRRCAFSIRASRSGTAMGTISFVIDFNCSIGDGVPVGVAQEDIPVRIAVPATALPVERRIKSLLLILIGRVSFELGRWLLTLKLIKILIKFSSKQVYFKMGSRLFWINSRKSFQIIPTKMKKPIPIKFVMVALAVLLFSNAWAQVTTPRTPSPAAKISQTIGISTVVVKYSRPSVKGREVWGKLVPFGWNVQAFGAGNSAPWRAGANENTTIEFSHPLKICGQEVPAGVYGRFFFPSMRMIRVK